MDTRGVDYAFLDKEGDLISNLYHSRDHRTEGIPEEVFEIIPKKEIYEETGIQHMQINTIYQLFAHLKSKLEIVCQTRYILTLPNLLYYCLTGILCNEYSHITTTQLYNPLSRQWSWKLISRSLKSS